MGGNVRRRAIDGYAVYVPGDRVGLPIEAVLVEILCGIKSELVVTLIEWAELFSEQLPEEYLQVTLLLDGAGRKAVLTANGERYEELLQEVEKFADLSN